MHRIYYIDEYGKKWIIRVPKHKEYNRHTENNISQFDIESGMNEVMDKRKGKLDLEDKIRLDNLADGVQYHSEAIREKCYYAYLYIRPRLAKEYQEDVLVPYDCVMEMWCR